MDGGHRWRDGFARPDVTGAFGRLLQAAGQTLVELRDPLRVELVISEICAAWSGPGCGDAEHDPSVVIGEGFIAHAEQAGTAEALAILRGLAALGSERQRSAANAAADRLATRGIPEPPWADRLDGVRLTCCFAYGDIYRDRTSVLLGFERGGQRHSVMVLVEHNLGEIAADSAVAGPPEEVLAAVVPRVRQRRVTLRRLDPAVARGAVEAAVAATDRAADAALSSTYWSNRSLILARLQALPPARPSRLPDLEPEERAAIVAEFLASPHGAGLGDREAARRCAGLIIDHGCAYDENRVLRVSPMKTQIFLLAWVPLNAMLSAAEREAMPEVVAAWVRWAGERRGLPPWARAELDTAVADLGAKFPGAYADPYQAGPAKSWVAGPGEKVPGFGRLRDVLDRRTFVLPHIGTRIGDTDYPQLDADDPAQRRLLILGEHPEYHEALDGSAPSSRPPGSPAPGSSDVADAPLPESHVATHEIVATQLWHDDPPEAWQAAQRLTGAGVERHDVLHALGKVVTRHLKLGVPVGELAGNEAYRRDLDGLGRSPRPRPAGDADQEPCQ